MFDSLSLDPKEIKSVITDFSHAISDISSVSHLSKEFLVTNLFSLKEKSLSKLYRIADNTEVSLGLKPGILTQNVTNQCGIWFKDIIDKYNIELDVSSISQSQGLLISYIKRIKNQEKKMGILSGDQSAENIRNNIFGKKTNKENAPFSIIYTLQGGDFSNSEEGKINRTKFLNAYDSLQPYFSTIDYNYDRKFYLSMYIKAHTQNFFKGCARLIFFF